MFGRKKMYKKGLADAMQAYEAFGEKQIQALEYMRKEVQEGSKRLEDAINDAVEAFGGNIQGLYDHLNAKEKAALYQLNTPTDIKELPDEEKRYLLAVLYQLSDDQGDSVTSDQRAFIRSVRRYLEISNPQAWADLTAVENIDSIDSQKAILQVVLEFFYLREGDEISDAQEEFLGYFSVNKKQAEAIEVRVSRLYNAMGAQGIAEKYGYVPEEEPETESMQDSTCENAVLATQMEMDSGDETEETVADKIFWELKSSGSEYVEVQDYIVYKKYSKAFLGFSAAMGLFAVSKKTGESKCLFELSDYPRPCCRNIEKWPSAGNRIYAFFADDTSASTLSEVYIIDVSTGESVSAGFKVDSWNTCATNGRYFVHSHDYGKLSCVDLVAKKKYGLVHQDHDNNDRFCTEKALYFTDRNVSPEQLMEYSFDNRTEKVLTTLPYIVGTEAMSVYGDRIFVLLNREGPHSIGYSDLNTGNYQCVETEEALYLYRARIKKYKDGWLIVERTGRISFFDFDSLKIITLAMDCTPGDVVRRSNGFWRIGKWVYFEQGEDRVNMKVAIDQPMKIEPVGEPL